LHELEVVDENEVEAAFTGEAPRFGAQFGDGQRGRVVEPDVRLGELARGADDVALLAFRLLAEAEACAVDAGLRRKQADGELFGGHLEGEERDVRALVDGGVTADAKGEARLSDAGTRANDDQVGALEAA